MKTSVADQRDDSMTAQISGLRTALALVLGATFLMPAARSTEVDQVFGNGDAWLKSECAECGEGCGEGCNDSSCCNLFAADPTSPVQFAGSVVGVYQGVLDGGNQRTWEFGGSGSYTMGLNLGQMGLKEGLMVNLRADHHYGHFIASQAGVIVPPALAATTPNPSTDELLLTNLMITQVLNENWTVFFGKMDTLDGDRNPLASGRGRTGFMNTSLLLPVNGVPVVPFVSVGAGAIYSIDGNPVASLLLLDPNDSTTTTGLSDLFEDGVMLLGSVNLPFSFIENQMGLHSFSAAWSGKEYVNLTQNDPRVILPNVPMQPTTGGWVAWWSGTQFIQQFDPKNDPMKGWGLFGRFGMSDRQVAPITYWANLGFGGNSPICGRHEDRWGVGWFYGSFSSGLGPVVNQALNLGSDGNGVELFYSFQVNKNFYLTPDFQVIDPGRNGVDTAIVAGLRGELRI